MMFKELLLFVSLYAVALAASTKVNKCQDSKAVHLTNEEVEISACAGPPCPFKKRTEPSVSIKLKPAQDVNELVTKVTANILGIPFPFIGVDGTSACPHIFSEDGAKMVGCPLKAGQSYVYKNSFKILELYPKIRVTVHWALVNNSTREDLICFEILAKIT